MSNQGRNSERDYEGEHEHGSEKGKAWDWDGRGWWEERTLPEKIVLGIGMGILGLGLLALYGWIVMLLWNWLMPKIFGLVTLNYWEAWGLLILCTLLFQGLGSSDKNNSSDRKRKRHLRRYLRENPQEIGANDASKETSKQ